MCIKYLKVFITIMFLLNYRVSFANNSPEKSEITLHIYQPNWQSVNIVYRQGNNKNFQQKNMVKASNHWWQITLPVTELEYYLTNGEQIINLGNVLGCYQGVHYPCLDKKNKPDNFRTTASQTWLKNGLQSITNPDEHIPSLPVFTLLSLNLHTYQEFSTNNTEENKLTTQQALTRIIAHQPLFKKIAAAINQLEPDAICLQEVGEWGYNLETNNNSKQFGISSTNAVHQILKYLNNKKYHAFMDWSHYGWQVWKEGTAVISKHPFIYTGSRYLSKNRRDNHRFWKSRKATQVQISTKHFGTITLFSVHTGWWHDKDEPFKKQFQQLTTWAQQTSKTKNTFFCGDFNQAASTQGYNFMTKNSGYRDQYILANPSGMMDATIGGNIAGWENSNGGKRVDYILLKNSSHLKVKLSQRIFTEKAFGRVSDHLGIYAQFIKD